MDSMKQLGDLKKMRDQAQEIQKKLADIKITVEHLGVTVVMTGDQKVVSISGPSTSHSTLRSETSGSDSKSSGQVEYEKVTHAVNEALKQSQKVAAEEMKGMMGGMGLPGM